MIIILGYVVNIITSIVFYNFNKKEGMPIRSTLFVIITFSTITFGMVLFTIGAFIVLFLIKFFDWLAGDN